MKLLTSLCSLLLSALLSQGLHAQTGIWTTTLTGGPAIPVGAFAGANDVGYDLNLGANYEFFHHFGVTVLGDLKNFSAGGGVRMESIVAGPSYTLPLGKSSRWTMIARALGGVSNRPAYATHADMGAGVYNPYLGHPASRFTYQGGVGMRYRLSGLWFIEGDADFWAAHVSWEQTIPVPVGGNFTSYAYRWITDPQNSVSLTAGIGLSFGR